jgi:predicted ATPase
MEWLEELPHTPDRDHLELEFTIALGVQMVLTRGHSAPEVEATYSRAKDLCERVGDASQHFQVLLGLRRCYLHREELEKANEFGKQLISLAENSLDSTYLSRAYGMHIEILYRLGEFAQIPNYGSQGLSLYDPEQSLTHVYLYGNDTRISIHMFMTLALWYLGYPEQALEIAREMLAWARKLAHPFTLVCGLYFAATLYQLRQEVEAVQECVDELLQISADRGFALYSGWGTMLQGWALTEQGKAREGIQCMQQSLVAWDEMGAKLMMPTLLYFLAEAYAKTGRVDEGLRLLDQALVNVEETKERTIEAELHRSRGELFLLRGAGGSEAERCFEQAFRVARFQSARSLELRAAVSLSRLWLKQGKVLQAIELLEGVYGWFSEGFHTRDLLDAKLLLDELNSVNS